MKVSCQACGAKYTIADDKVRGRKVKIRCKSCGAPIVVDAASEAPPADPAAGPSAAAATAAPAAAVPTSAKNETWSVNLSDTDQRNMTTEEIIAGWKSGEVTSDAFVWKDGMGDWVAILECAELRDVLPSQEAAPDPSATPFGPTIVTAPTAAATKGLPAARVTGGRARGGVDLFDAVEGGGEEEVATSAPAFPGMAGTQPYDDGKMTGARNENSVLFSLDSLKGGLAAAAAEPKKKSAPNRDLASDPLVASPVSALGGGGSPLFSLSADQALLTAPAAPDPPPRAAETGEGRGPGPNKLVIYGGAAAAMVVLLAVGVMLGRSGKDEAAAEAAASASAAAEKKAAADKEEEKKEEKKKEEKAAEEKKEEAKAEASASPAASASAKKGTTSTPTDKKTATATPTSTAAPTATEKKEEAAPAAGTAPFSVSAAQVALTTAASNAAGCKKPDGPTGSGKVKVTFATSGRVTSATVDGPPFAGTPVGGCVAGVFRRAKVPPYAGNPVTVSKSFSIK